jgi:hypothetical protein
LQQGRLKSGRKSRRKHVILRWREGSVKKKDAPNKLMLAIILPIAQHITSPHGSCVWFARRITVGGRGACVTPALWLKQKSSV